MAVAANNKFEIASLDIRAAFLQARKLDRPVFVLPPKDIRKKGVLWRLLKPLYGLDDASRRFWLRIKEIFFKMGMKIMEGDEAFYFLHYGKELKGAVLTHVDDFTIAGRDDFVAKVIEAVEKELTISKVEYGNFRFTGVDVKKTDKGIEVSMDDYAESIGKIEEFRKAKRDDMLLPSEMKVYRGFTGKIGWLAENVRPDLSFTALEMSKKGSSATMSDLKKVNHTIKKVKERQSRMLYSSIADRNEDIEVIGVGDASYKWDDKSVGGCFIMIANKKTKKAVPVYWKSKQISRTVHSSKDAETLNLAKLVDDSVFVARQLEILLFGVYKGTIPVRLFTDSEPTLESIASTRPIETKRLRNQVQELKEVLLNGEVDSYAWLSTKDMLADVLTKEMRMNKDVEDLMMKNAFHLVESSVNKVQAMEDELRMTNIRNRNVNENDDSTDRTKTVQQERKKEEEEAGE